MREFYLVNEEGVKFELGCKSRILVSGVDNIGFTKEVEYLDFDLAYKKAREKNPIQDITLSLTFLNGYKGYQRFLEFIESSSYFRLYYKSIEFKYCYCEIESLSKGELTFGTLQSNLLIKRLSYWYNDVVNEVQVEDFSKAKCYPYKYPYRYKSSAIGKLKVANNGYSKAPLRIILEGAFDTPEVTVYKNQSKVSSMRIYYKTNAGKLVVNSSPIKQYIEITDNGKKIDGYEHQDFSVENFIFLDRGNYDIVVDAHVSKPPTCTIIVSEGYLSN